MIEYYELAVLLSLASLLGLLANRLRLPPLLGYISAGVLANALNLFSAHSAESFELFSQIGITFLLFILGLELNISELKKIGKLSIIIGLGQIMFTTGFGYLLSLVQGFTPTMSLYLSIGLTFSSTIVIVKLLSLKHEVRSLHGKISIGFLLVQDFAAIFILISLVAFSPSESNGGVLLTIGFLILKIFALILIVWAFSKFFIPWIISKTSHDREVLFLIVISWALLFSTIVSSPIFDFSIEIGALLSGIALSSRKEALQIESWTKSLRDFFLTVFFVLLGFNINIASISTILVPSIVFSLFVLIGNPLIVMFIMGLLGYNKRTSFFTSLTVAQISEFSLLIASLGSQIVGETEGSELISTLTLVGGITMAISSYMIFYKEPIYMALKDYLKIFEFTQNRKRGTYSKEFKDHVIIFGFHRLGQEVLIDIKEKPQNYLIVEQNPTIVSNLKEEGIQVIFGDAIDTEIYPSLGIENAKLIVSTVPEYNANHSILRYVKDENLNIPVILSSENDEDTLELYENEADFVIYPHLQASRRLKKMIDYNKTDRKEKLSNISTREINSLKKRLNLVAPTTS